MKNKKQGPWLSFFTLARLYVRHKCVKFITMTNLLVCPVAHSEGTHLNVHARKHTHTHTHTHTHIKLTYTRTRKPMHNRTSMACPALPLCGLATTEAERALPDINVRIRASMVKSGLPADEPLIVRMTGCPNGCARPYIAELGFVGDGPNSYQVCLCVCCCVRLCVLPGGFGR